MKDCFLYDNLSLYYDNNYLCCCSFISRYISYGDVSAIFFVLIRGPPSINKKNNFVDRRNIYG